MPGYQQIYAQIGLENTEIFWLPKFLSLNVLRRIHGLILIFHGIQRDHLQYGNTVFCSAEYSEDDCRYPATLALPANKIFNFQYFLNIIA